MSSWPPPSAAEIWSERLRRKLEPLSHMECFDLLLPVARAIEAVRAARAREGTQGSALDAREAAAARAEWSRVVGSSASARVPRF